jgi:nitric oxide dioxygenase
VLTLAQCGLVRSSWARVALIADVAAIVFSQRVFELDPSLAPRYSSAYMLTRGTTLLRMVDTMVVQLDDEATLALVVDALGQRANAWQVPGAHPDVIAAALLWALEIGSGSPFTARTREAWQSAVSALVYGAPVGDTRRTRVAA